MCLMASLRERCLECRSGFRAHPVFWHVNWSPWLGTGILMTGKAILLCFIFSFFTLCVCIFYNPHLRICLLILERGNEREKHKCERKTKHWWPPIHAPTGIKPATWVCVLTGNRTHNPLVYGMTLQPTEPPRWGLLSRFLNKTQRGGNEPVCA